MPLFNLCQMCGDEPDSALICHICKEVMAFEEEVYGVVSAVKVPSAMDLVYAFKNSCDSAAVRAALLELAIRRGGNTLEAFKDKKNWE